MATFAKIKLGRMYESPASRESEDGGYLMCAACLYRKADDEEPVMTVSNIFRFYFTSIGVGMVQSAYGAETAIDGADEIEINGIAVKVSDLHGEFATWELFEKFKE